MRFDLAAEKNGLHKRKIKLLILPTRQDGANVFAFALLFSVSALRSAGKKNVLVVLMCACKQLLLPSAFFFMNLTRLVYP